MITDLIPGLVWGATPGERALPLPCDDLLPDAGTTADRAISVDTPPAVVFAWLCQLRVAPYSYDLFDNFGKRSPRTRNPELADLQLGQRFMSLFDLVSFAADEHITLRTNRVVTTYSVRRAGSGSRLHVRVLFEGPAVLARALALGDLVMMRKQLLVLKELAEHEAAHVG